MSAVPPFATEASLNRIADALSGIYALQRANYPPLAVNVLNYGAKGDGVTDDTAAIKAAIAKAEAIGSKYLVFNGVFKITSPLDIPEGMTVDLSSGVINATEFVDSGIGNNPDPVFRVFGTEAGGTELAADASAYGWSITVSDASDLEPGDLLFIQSNEHWYTDTSTSVGKATIAKVRAVSGAAVSLHWPLPMDFDATSYTVAVTIIKPKRGVSIIGGTIIGPGYQGPKENNVGPAAIHARYFEGLRVIGTHIEGFQGSAIMTYLGMDVVAEGIRIQGHSDNYNDPIVEGQNSGFYGLFFSRTRGIRAIGVIGYRTRHLIDSAYSQDGIVIGCQSYNSHQNAYTCHAGSTDWTFDSCSAYDGSASLQWRGFNLTVVNCTFDSLTDDKGTNGIYDMVGGANDIPRRYIFANNKIRCTRAGISISSTVGSALIHDNTILYALQSGYHGVHVGSLHYDHVSIRGNHIEALNPSGTDYAIGSYGTPVRRKLIRAEGNTIVNYTSQALRMTSVDDETVIIFKDNVLSPNGATVHFFNSAGTPKLVVTGPNYTDGGVVYGMEKLAQLQIAPGSSVSPEANGDVVLELTNNTTLTVKAKGNDSNIRSGVITLS